MDHDVAWDGTDFSPLFRARVVDGAIPLSLACISFAILAGTFTFKRIAAWLARRRRRKRSSAVPAIGFGGPAGLPSLIVETGHEHEENDSHDAMLEAENAVIRESVKRSGIVWPEAFRALGLLKEKEDHHQKPNLRKTRYLQVPEDGHDHASDSWIQWWKAGQRDMRRLSRWQNKWRRIKWKRVLQNVRKNGKKNFVQSNLAWAVVALLFVNAYESQTKTVWNYAACGAWTYFTLLLEVRMYSAAMHRSPFVPRIFNTITIHVNPFFLIYFLISLLDDRSTFIHRPSRSLVIQQAFVSGLSLIILLLEILVSQPSPFVKKSQLHKYRQDIKDKYKYFKQRSSRPDSRMSLDSSGSGTASPRDSIGNHSRNSTSNGTHGPPARAPSDFSDDGLDRVNERTSLLRGANLEDDVDMDVEDDEYMAVLDLLPEDDEKEFNPKRVAPPLEVGASIFSLCTFTYIGGFMLKHTRQVISAADVPDLRADDKAASVVLEFRAACKTYPRWLRLRANSGMRARPSIFLQMCWYFLPELGPQFAWAFVRPWCSVMMPLFIRLLLQWTTARAIGEAAPIHVALLYVLGLFCSQMATSISQCQALIIGRRLCVRAKALVIAEVFTKALRRKDLAGQAGASSGAKGPASGNKAGSAQNTREEPASTGRVQNLVSVDAARIAELFAYIHWLPVEAPLTVALALTLLYSTIGYSAFAAVGAMVFLLPCQTVVARLFMRYQNQVLVAADHRLSLTTEVFQAIKILKFFAWEEKFAKKLEERRQVELVALQKRVVIFAISGMFLFGASIVIAVFTFVVHTKVLHQPLTATTAFTALALFNTIKGPLDQVADQVSQFLTTIISCRRVDALLREEETAKYSIITAPSAAGDPKIGFTNASLTWSDVEAVSEPDSTAFRLKDLNLRFSLDGLNLIVGPVGSGKSSILFALLGEMNLLNGRCFIPSPVVRDANIDPSREVADTVAFCAQTPWLLNDSIRANILFGAPYNANRYKQVLYSCALLPDLAVLEHGDRTEVGEKGTVLSGGQKARISLARAVYSAAKVLLLDDILSAVDTHTAKHLYHHCLTSDNLMRGRTRILVTHALHLTLPLADYVVAVSSGYVAYSGPAEGYIHASGANTPGLAAGQDFSSLIMKGSLESGSSQPPLSADQVARAVVEANTEHLFLESPLHEETLLTTAEKQSTGSVSWSVYSYYIKAAVTPLGLVALLTVITVTEASSITTNWLLRLWASSFERQPASGALLTFPATAPAKFDGLGGPYQSDDYFFYYVIAAGFTLVLFVLRVLFILSRGIVASKSIYNGVMASLLAAPVRFYDQTPFGRIMNRLSSDMATTDQEVPAKTMFFLLEISGTIAVVTAIVIALPAFLLIGIAISIGYAYIGYIYLASSRELKRIESVTRSPLYSLVGECITGVTSIRAYSDQSRFTAKLFDLVDATNGPFFVLWLTNRWLSIRTDLGGSIVAVVTAFLIIFNGNISASLAGFALTYAIVMEERILWLVRMYAGVQIQLNSVERLREYTVDLPQEPSGGKEPPAHWPSGSSGIQVEDLIVRYADDQAPALKGITFDVKASERVAIVGRTGSGKSTLALSFFRFVEAAKGRIIVDGIDISTVPLSTLRDRLTIIPQDATLFKGSVRFNLDPFEQFSDAELYDVLKRTNLLANRNATTTGQGGIATLDDEVQEGAKNFSAGQRQLLCLARGLLKLRGSNLLFLDESTANLDSETDMAVQQTIREEMGGATILCIAHRLHTIIDFDRVLVLGSGKIIEYDTPAALLDKGESSEFYKLCKESGDLEKLKSLAKSRAVDA